MGDLLAHGGMAELFFARAAEGSELERARGVALKRVLPEFRRDAEFMEMFRHEGRVMGLLDHPNIATVYELGLDAGEPFIAMEYIHGESLRSLLRARRGPLPVEVAVPIVLATAEALHYAHELRDPDGSALDLVHRDVSPGNIVLGYDGTVHLVDFGIAKLVARTRITRTGTLKGKVGYMSPEQIRGLPIDRRTDVFCLGVVLYETLTGRNPFARDSDFAVMHAITAGEFPPVTAVDASIPAELERILAAALATDADQRTSTAEEFADDLRVFAEDTGFDAESQTAVSTLLQDCCPPRPYPSVDTAPRTALAWPDEQAPSEPRRSRRVAVLAGLTGVACAVGLGAYVASRSADSVGTPRSVTESPPQEPQLQPAVTPVAEVSPPTAAAPRPEPVHDEAPTAKQLEPEPPAKRVKKPRRTKRRANTSPSPSPASSLRPPSRRGG